MDARVLKSSYKLINIVKSSLPSRCWPYVIHKSSFTIHVDGSFYDFVDIKVGWAFVSCTPNTCL